MEYIKYQASIFHLFSYIQRRLMYILKLRILADDHKEKDRDSCRA